MFKALDATGNFIRALVSLVLVGILGAGGWVGYRQYYANELAFKEQQQELERQRATIASLNRDLEIKQKEIERLDLAVRLLKVDQRVAQLDVLDQRQSPDGKLLTRFTFAEVDESGQSLEEPRQVQIEGDIVYVDAWVVSFKDEFVEQGDPLRGKSLYLFRRIFGEHQAPSEGYPLDQVNSRPAAYSRGSNMSDFERETWKNFWQYAIDAAKANDDGVQFAGGKASATKLVPGKRYRVLFRSTGDLKIVPDPAGAKAL
jgi:hypothetical protein